MYAIYKRVAPETYVFITTSYVERFQCREPLQPDSSLYTVIVGSLPVNIYTGMIPNHTLLYKIVPQS